MHYLYFTGDRKWDCIILLFTRHTKLQNHLSALNFEERIIDVRKLKRLSKMWSTSEKFMLDLALHLYSDNHVVNLHCIDYLDTSNRKLAFEALGQRFQYKPFIEEAH